ncbi:MAG: KH domain-containing protein [Candidatus Micrarchaeia archaeon]
MGRLVIPGDLLLDKPIRNPYTYIKEGKTYAAIVGMFDDQQNKFMPIKASYLPSLRDSVIGIIEEEKVIGYGVNLFSPYHGLLSSKMLRTTFNVGDIILAEVSEISEVKDIWLSRPVKLVGGEIIDISPTKISRVIGKHSSMLNILKIGTGCEIIVGKNGLIWIKGQNSAKAIDAIEKISREAHTSGLTDRIMEYLGVTQEMLKRFQTSREQYRF